MLVTWLPLRTLLPLPRVSQKRNSWSFFRRYPCESNESTRSNDVSPHGNVGIPQNQQSWIIWGCGFLAGPIHSCGNNKNFFRKFFGLRHCLQFIELGLNSLLSLWGSSETTSPLTRSYNMHNKLGGVGDEESNRSETLSLSLSLHGCIYLKISYRQALQKMVDSSRKPIPFLHPFIRCIYNIHVYTHYIHK